MLCITLGRTQLPGEFAERLQFRKLEQDLAAQLAALESMKSDSGLQAEMQFESKLRGLLAEYGYSLRDVINLLGSYGC